MPEDQQAALEWQTWKRTLCDGCGHPMDETTGEDGPEYEGFAVTCFACMAREREARKYQEHDSADTAGVKFGVRIGDDGG